ncbi:MAG: tripartite tricarboxylate transporter substrate-binding protein, partial [Deltaproteobacteria bacterium]|nr:tripartite tricarboxylate transporter substrate-binding protein [Deltaproteobacteria bacterium]
MNNRLRVIPALVLFSAFLATPLSAQTPYYQGKTISIVAGTKAGDVYDIYARIFAQYLPKYIPGNPNIIVQNMPGAGSMIAANFVYNVSKADGLTMGAIFPALYFDQVVGRPEVKFDWSKFVWLGSPVTSNHLLYMRADSPFKTIDDVVKTKAPPKCGATGTSSTAYYIPKLLDEAM